MSNDMSNVIGPRRGPRHANRLTAIDCKQAQPASKPYRLTDGNGLALLVQTNGSKLWQLRYRLHGKYNVHSIGSFPEVGLKVARAERDLVRSQYIRNGIKPPSRTKIKMGAAQQIAVPAAANSSLSTSAYHGVTMTRRQTLMNAAEQWFNTQRGVWTEANWEKSWKRYEDNMLNELGHLDIADLTPSMLYGELVQIASKEQGGKNDSNATVVKIARWTKHILAMALEDHPNMKNPAELLARKFPESAGAKHMPAIAPSEYKDFLTAFDSVSGSDTVRNSFEFLQHVPIRSIEVRGMEWSEIDFKHKQIRIPGERMKSKRNKGRELLIPMTKDVKAILNRQKKITGKCRYVWESPSKPGQYISEGAWHSLIERMEYSGKMCPHGFRAGFSSYLNEQGINPDAIEIQIGHKVAGDNAVRAAYIHLATFGKERVKLMQLWSDFIRERPETNCPLSLESMELVEDN